MRCFRFSWSAAIYAFVFLFGNIPQAVAQSTGSLSVFSLNVHGLEHDGGISWERRAERFAIWVRDNQVVPDIIGLQEIWGWLWTPPVRSCGGLGLGVGAGDYDQLDVFLKALRDTIGVTYRIAYMTGKVDHTTNTPFPCHIYHAQAVLYNPARLVNVMPAQTGMAHDDAVPVLIVNPHLRNSLPLCNRGTHLMPLESLIDGPPQTDKCGRQTPSGPAWAVFAHEKRHIAASFVRLAFRADPSKSIDVFNVHPNANNEQADLGAIRALINQFTRPSSVMSRYYAPIMVADRNDLEIDEALSPFKIVLNPSTDLSAIAIADIDKVPAQYKAHMVQGMIMPVPELAGVSCKGSLDQLVSDHCGVFVRFDLDEPNAGAFRKVFVEGPLSVYIDEDFTLSAVPSGGGPQFKYLWQPGGFTTASVQLRGAASNKTETWTVQMTDLSSGTTMTADHSVVTTRKRPPACNSSNCCECNPHDLDQCEKPIPARGNCQ